MENKLFEPAVPEGPHAAAAAIAHFVFGALAGTGFAFLPDESPIRTGVKYGLSVYAGSYLGYLPATGLVTPRSQRSSFREAELIFAHVVWGATLGCFYHRTLSREKAA
jgi:hypothetical protein